MTNITPSQLQDYETLNEGYSKSVYLDSVNLPTIGIGHNIYAGGAAAINNLPGNPSYNNVLNGTQDLTDEQVQALFENDMAAAIAIAQNLFPNWDYLPNGVQAALADMAFNLGNRLGQFIQLQNDIAVMDFTQAAADIANSRWANQVGVRAERDETLLTLDEQLLEQFEDISDIIDDLVAHSPDFSALTDWSDPSTDPATPTAPGDGIEFTPDGPTDDTTPPGDTDGTQFTPDGPTDDTTPPGDTDGTQFTPDGPTDDTTPPGDTDGTQFTPDGPTDDTTPPGDTDGGTD